MQVCKTIGEMREFTRGQHKFDRSVGLVPTMGYLHQGHVSLMERSVSENDATVVSIFVNPTQFMPGEDLERYPRDLDGDLEKCEEADVDAVFAPEASEMYRPHAETVVVVPGLSNHLCGISRGVGHFNGVCTVVSKLFNIVRPDRAYFGQKDAQQAVVINRMAVDLDLGVEVVVCPIVREHDGLALSSRNTYLSPEHRARAVCLYRALCTGRELIREGEKAALTVLSGMMEVLEKEPDAELDYLEIVDPEALQEAAWIDDTVLIAGAIRLGGVRLIDNLIVHPQNGPWQDGE